MRTRQRVAHAPWCASRHATAVRHAGAAAHHDCELGTRPAAEGCLQAHRNVQRAPQSTARAQDRGEHVVTYLDKVSLAIYASSTHGQSGRCFRHVVRVRIHQTRGWAQEIGEWFIVQRRSLGHALMPLCLAQRYALSLGAANAGRTGVVRGGSAGKTDSTRHRRELVSTYKKDSPQKTVFR